MEKTKTKRNHLNVRTAIDRRREGCVLCADCVLSNDFRKVFAIQRLQLKQHRARRRRRDKRRKQNISKNIRKINVTAYFTPFMIYSLRSLYPLRVRRYNDAALTLSRHVCVCECVY